MNNRLSFTESELQLKTFENDQLKSVVSKLKSSIVEQQLFENQHVETSCKACLVF